MRGAKLRDVLHPLASPIPLPIPSPFPTLTVLLLAARRPCLWPHGPPFTCQLQLHPIVFDLHPLECRLSSTACILLLCVEPLGGTSAGLSTPRAALHGGVQKPGCTSGLSQLVCPALLVSS